MARVVRRWSGCGRVWVAVSSLYRILSGGEPGSLVDAGVYLRSVSETVAASVGSGDGISVEVHATDRELTTAQAAALGLITNEAMTNAYKHAFPGRASGRIVVSLREDRAALTLSLADDGCGMPETAREGLGTTLIESLAMDLGGDVSIRSGDGGTCVAVRFPG